LALLLMLMVEVDAQPEARPWPPPLTVTVVAPEAKPQECVAMFWSIFQFMPPASRPMRPLRYCLPIWSEGVKRPFSASTIVAEVNGSITTARRPSRGAASASRKAPAVR
jgi:hypothetical protein